MATISLDRKLLFGSSELLFIPQRFLEEHPRGAFRDFIRIVERFALAPGKDLAVSFRELLLGVPVLILFENESAGPWSSRTSAFLFAPLSSHQAAHSERGFLGRPSLALAPVDGAERTAVSRYLFTELQAYAIAARGCSDFPLSPQMS